MPVNDSGEDLVRRLYLMIETNPERAWQVITACRENTPAVFDRLHARLGMIATMIILADQEREEEE